MTNGPVRPRDPPSELRKLQLDYAWKWFSYHADQRVKMFNFMLVVFGIFATAIVSAVNYHLAPGSIAVLCIIAAMIGLIFARLDRRNRDLVGLGEELLTHLEKNFVFGEGITIKDRSGKDIQLGILSRQSFEDDERATDLCIAWGKGIRDVWRGWTSWRAWGRCIDDAWHGKHRVWLPFVGTMMFILFSIAAVWLWKRPQ
jgi:hypothetical protein